MRDFNRNRGRSGGGFRKRNQQTSFHKAICAECGNECELPFKPTSDKPVFCSNCFEKQNKFGGDRGNRGNRSNNRNSRGNDRTMYSATCDACSKECQVPFKPTGDKPIYCDDCFKSNDDGYGRREKRNSNQQEQFDKINEKLDRLLRALEIRGRIPTDEDEE